MVWFIKLLVKTFYISNHISAYFELYRIGSIRQFLSIQITITLVCAFVLSKLDYCNSILSGCPLHLLEKLQKVQNSAARLIFKSKKVNILPPFWNDFIGFLLNSESNTNFVPIASTSFLEHHLPTFRTYSQFIHQQEIYALRLILEF